jgi:hypothetical protein
MMRQVVAVRHRRAGQDRRLRPRRQDRHHQRLSRRLVRRLHRRLRHRGLGRARRQHADEAGHRRRRAGGDLAWLHGPDSWPRRSPAARLPATGRDRQPARQPSRTDRAATTVVATGRARPAVLAEAVQPGPVRPQPGAVWALVADQPPGLGPEGGAVVRVQQVGALVGGDVIGDGGRGQGKAAEPSSTARARRPVRGRRRHRRRPHRRGGRGHRPGPARDRRQGQDRHPRLRRHPHPLRRPGHLGSAAGSPPAGTASPPR